LYRDVLWGRRHGCFLLSLLQDDLSILFGIKTMGPARAGCGAKAPASVRFF
jgi:hypothetical protein